MDTLIKLFIKSNLFTSTTKEGKTITGYLKDQDEEAIILATNNSWILTALEDIASIRLNFLNKEST